MTPVLIDMRFILPEYPRASTILSYWGLNYLLGTNTIHDLEQTNPVDHKRFLPFSQEPRNSMSLQMAHQVYRGVINNPIGFFGNFAFKALPQDIEDFFSADYQCLTSGFSFWYHVWAQLPVQRSGECAAYIFVREDETLPTDAFLHSLGFRIFRADPDELVHALTYGDRTGSKDDTAQGPVTLP
jgi:hypothetical protein